MMRIISLKRTTLAGIPSASGIEYYQNAYYVVGDNCSCLFELNEQFEFKQKYPLIDSEDHNQVIPKSAKPDFEAITIIRSDQTSWLYIFGSGSAPTRNQFVKLNLSKPSEVEQFDLSSLYKRLSAISRAGINLEAAFSYGEYLFLANRADNAIFRLKLDAFNAYVSGNSSDISIDRFLIDVPMIQERYTGLSGAAVIPETSIVIFTASCENTTNWIDDGEVLGSSIGLFDLNELSPELNTVDFIEIPKSAEESALKIESVAISMANQSGADLVLVSDSDGGESELVQIRISF